MKLLFLDIDGVLNNHTPLESGYNGICYARAHLLNVILDCVPDLQIVVSSAWRYMILEGAMNLKGFAHLLAIHGIKSHGRLHGHTEADVHPDKQPCHFDRDLWRVMGLKWRAEQINRYVAQHKPDKWAVLDDLPLEIENLFQTEDAIGLTVDIARSVVRALQD